ETRLRSRGFKPFLRRPHRPAIRGGRYTKWPEVTPSTRSQKTMPSHSTKSQRLGGRGEQRVGDANPLGRADAAVEGACGRELLVGGRAIAAGEERAGGVERGFCGIRCRCVSENRGGGGEIAFAGGRAAVDPHAAHVVAHEGS